MFESRDLTSILAVGLGRAQIKTVRWNACPISFPVLCENPIERSSRDIAILRVVGRT
jgi:hypothetical protein